VIFTGLTAEITIAMVVRTTTPLPVVLLPPPHHCHYISVNIFSLLIIRMIMIMSSPSSF
jgi:hypothetical protein